MIQAVIFDFGDVICFWNDDCLGERHSLDLGLPKDAIRNIIWDYFDAAHEGKYHSLEDYFSKLKPAVPVSHDVVNEVFQEMEASAHIDERMVELIIALKPRYKIALLSNFGYGIERYLNERFKIDYLFDVVVSSYDLRVKKPSPDIYQYAFKKLHLQAGECLFIDNNAGHVEAAIQHGMQGIVFENFDQCKSGISLCLRTSSRRGVKKHAT